MIDKILDCHNVPAKLTPAQREIVELIDAGHTVESAAEKLGIPVGTARWRLRRANRLEGIVGTL